MYDFLRAFFDLFFAPLYAMTLDNDIYVLIYAVILVMAVWSVLRRILTCLGSI